MKKIIFFLFVLFNFSYAGICKDISDFVLVCFEKREFGEIKSCSNKEYSKLKFDKKYKNWFLKACQYGCLSESMYEANEMSEFIFNECKTKLKK